MTERTFATCKALWPTLLDRAQVIGELDHSIIAISTLFHPINRDIFREDVGAEKAALEAYDALIIRLEDLEEDYIDFAKTIQTTIQLEAQTLQNRGTLSAATLAHLERHIESSTEESLKITELLASEFDVILRKVRDVKPETKQEQELFNKVKEYIRDTKAIASFKIKKIFENFLPGRYKTL